MTIKVTGWLLTAACMLWSHFGAAQWYQTQGQATIIGDDRERAHDLAVRDAVKQALLYAGASVSSLQELNTGVVTQDRLWVHSDGEIRGLQLLEQHIDDKLLTVSINVDIVARQARCQASRYAKAVMVTGFKLRHREQAVTGGLFQLGSAIGERLHRQLSRQPARFDTRNWLNANYPFAPESLDSRDDTAHLMRGLAKQNDSQFVVAGRINDISLINSRGRHLLDWFKPVERVFDTDIWLFDGISGEAKGHWNYRVTADWEYEPEESVDLAGSRFWNSQYGRVINQVIDQAQMDLEQALECEPLQGWVIRTELPQLQINLGSRNGIKPGDAFTVWHNSAYFDQDGHARIHWQETGSRFKISALYPHHAVLDPLDDYPYVSVQLNDFVRPLASTADNGSPLPRPVAAQAFRHSAQRRPPAWQ